MRAVATIGPSGFLTGSFVKILLLFIRLQMSSIVLTLEFSQITEFFYDLIFKVSS